jgi:hypothetical protein
MHSRCPQAQEEHKIYRPFPPTAATADLVQVDATQPVLHMVDGGADEIQSVARGWMPAEREYG